jgi:hypothetical protein
MPTNIFSKNCFWLKLRYSAFVLVLVLIRPVSMRYTIELVQVLFLGRLDSVFLYMECLLPLKWSQNASRISQLCRSIRCIIPKWKSSFGQPIETFGARDMHGVPGERDRSNLHKDKPS